MFLNANTREPRPRFGSPHECQGLSAYNFVEYRGVRLCLDRPEDGDRFQERRTSHSGLNRLKRIPIDLDESQRVLNDSISEAPNTLRTYRRGAMKRTYTLVVAAAILLSQDASATEFGTFEEARELLSRAIIALKADKQRAFEKFNANDPNYRDRDLFVFCFDAADGRLVAHEALVSHNVRELRDHKGKSYGESMLATAGKDHIAELTFLAPFPGTTLHVPKRAFFTRVDDHVCGVSAYLYNGPGTPNEYVPGSSP
jgi:hypothetical protein